MDELHENAMRMNDDWAKRCEDLLHKWRKIARIQLLVGMICGVLIGIGIGISIGRML